MTSQTNIIGSLPGDHFMTPEPDLYLDLLESCLLGVLNEDPPIDPWSGVIQNAIGEVVTLGAPNAAGVLTISPGEFNVDKRNTGRDWPATAPTMIGRKRLQNIRNVVDDVIANEIPGDLIETGVWRGGACIYMRGILKRYGDSPRGLHQRKRTVWAADSFEGLPPPSVAGDAGDWHRSVKLLSVSLDEVKLNFARYGLLDDRVRFLKGWFKDTLPIAPIEKLAVLRLDGDMYESTMDALESLYVKVSRGGYIIVDDFGSVPGCQQAVLKFRSDNRIADQMFNIDDTGIFWRVR